MKTLFALSLLAIVTGCQSLPQHPPTATAPWMDRTLPPEKRAELLVRQMTLDEKILQIHMLDQRQHPREVAGIDRLGIPTFRITNGPVGAGPGDDRPAKPATALPSALALAASWDPQLAETFGHICGQEVAGLGEHLIEGPGLNITRNPQNGRNFEYFGEDPYLSGRLGVAEVLAIQKEGVIAEIKHYAANNQESARKTINEIIDERTLREIYLPAFEATVKEADPGAVMAAYPSVNGAFCSENPHLLQDILRSDWGFKGFVQSDYTGTRSAVRGAHAGLDLSMKADHYAAEMKTAVTGGQVDQSIVDTMVLRRFTQMFRFGMFDETRSLTPIPAEKNGALARSIAAQSAVLLKNERATLPLRANEIHTIAVIGPYAGAAHTGGGGSSAVKPIYTVKPVDAIQKRLGPAVKVLYNNGADANDAATIAQSADVVLLMVGNKDSEGKDRPNLLLPGIQNKLISAVAAANPHTIVILKTGGPVMMPWLNEVPALLEAWYPGEEDGNVVADLLFGDVNPSGKLPMTFPRTEKEIPANTPAQYPGVGGVNGTAIYSEKLLVGYRWYDATNTAPLFPFGYGLSYTTFTLANLTATPPTPPTASPPTDSAPASVSLDITNTGTREGAEVAQVYVAAPASAGEPPKQLKGFAKVTLKPNETRHITIPLDPRAFSYWNTEKNTWTPAPGTHTILVGNSSRNTPLTTTINIP